MALRDRGYFFDPANLDRFNSRDIPTEQTMSDWSDSVPFFKEVIDRAQLTKAGLAKITTNDKINNRDDTDINGPSPFGFTTFVKPSQIFKVASADGSITVTENPRGGTGDDADVNDVDLAVNFPALPPIPEDDLDIITSQNYTIAGYDYNNPVNNPAFTSTTTLVAQNSQLRTLIIELSKGLLEATLAIDALRDSVNSSEIQLGDVLFTVTPPAQWSDDYLEPNGQSISQVNYPDLYNLFLSLGLPYGGGVGTFNLPDLTSKYVKTIPTSGALANNNGGSNTYSLTELNIPEHTHDFTGVTDTDGAHSHDIPADQGGGPNNVARRADPSSGTWALPSGGLHNHAFSGITDPWGTGSVTPITIEPEFNGFYLKMKVK